MPSGLPTIRLNAAISSDLTDEPSLTNNGGSWDVQFLASNNDGMPWEFSPQTTMMKVHPGAVNETVFLARNPLPRAMVAQAIPSISPGRAAAWFHKTECFCFNQQPLDCNRSAQLPLRFIVDQDLPRDIHTITLSYTLFDVTDMQTDALASR